MKEYNETETPVMDFSILYQSEFILNIEPIYFPVHYGHLQRHWLRK